MPEPTVNAQRSPFNPQATSGASTDAPGLDPAETDGDNRAIQPSAFSLQPSALAGLRVLDLAGPIGVYATRLLVGLGADVLRVEPPGGDALRRRPPFAEGVPGIENSLHHWHFNAGKRSLLLDLDTAADRDRFRVIAASADVVIETLAPGRLAALGIGYPDLAAENRGLILTSITPFGQTGPRSGWRGVDLTGAATTGVMAVNGFVGRTPYQPGGEHAYHQAGLIGAVGTLVALWERHRSGRGQHVDVSMQEALVMAESGLAIADIEGHSRPRLGLVNTIHGRPTLYRCLDGWASGVLGNRWAERIGWLESAGVLSAEQAERWRDDDYRAAHGVAELDRLTIALFATLPKETVYREAQRRRMAIGSVRTISDLFQDRQLAARDFFQPLPLPDSSPLDAGAPFIMSRTPWRITSGPPRLGQCESVGVWEGGRVSHTPTPLAGLRILDFSVQAAGPAATRLLASFGAEVIKVESSSHPDSMRLLPHPRPEGNPSVNVAGNFNNLGTNKLGISVDLDSPAGRAIIRELITISDVVLDNFGRDPFPRWGLSDEQVRAIRPDIIVARLSTVGRTGPDRDYVGFGFGIAALAGLNAVTGFPEDAPVGVGVLTDFTSNPYHAVVAILAALEHRLRTGEGQLIDLSQVESSICFLGPAVLDFQVHGKDSEPCRNRSLEMAPHGAYRCRGDDRWCAIAVPETDWEPFCQVAGHPEWRTDPRFATFAARKANEDALDSLVTEWTIDQDDRQLAERLQSAGIVAAPVLASLDLLHHDEHLAARGYHRRIEHPEAGRRAADGPPFQLSRTPGGPTSPAPCLGEHTDQVLRDTLGYDEDRISALYVERAIG